VTYPIPACSQIVLYSWRTTASSARRTAGVADPVQVRPVGLDVAEQALDPGLIGRRSGPAEGLGDGAHRHELAGRAARHLRPVVRDGEQHRRENVNVGLEGGGVGGHGVLACLDEVEQSLDLEARGRDQQCQREPGEEALGYPPAW
jgi:hypothetical protein